MKERENSTLRKQPRLCRDLIASIYLSEVLIKSSASYDS